MNDTRQFMTRFVEFINSANPDLAEELIAKDAAFHVPFQPEPLIGPQGYLATVMMMRSGFSDVRWTLEDMVSENGTIAARFTMRGTHDGAFMGVSPSGRPIQIQAINFYRISDGKIVEEHGQPDMLGLMSQIGAIPQP